MNRWIKPICLGLGLVLLTLLVTLLYLHIPQNAAGMAAKGVCSAAFVAHRPVEPLLNQDVLPASAVLRLVSIWVNPTEQSVTAQFAGAFTRRAVWLPRRGCVLDVPPLGTTATPASQPDPRPWPVGEQAVPPSDWGTGVNAPALQRVVAQAFVGAGDPLAANARALAVIHRGRLLCCIARTVLQPTRHCKAGL